MENIIECFQFFEHMKYYTGKRKVTDQAFELIDPSVTRNYKKYVCRELPHVKSLNDWTATKKHGIEI